nr:MAG TPA: hypothetical protein [Caudoviricetes sp.]
MILMTLIQDMIDIMYRIMVISLLISRSCLH